MITPAITVLGAVEGLKVATPFFDPYVVPAAVVILVVVFAIQRHGTHRVGGLFGPIMVIWFIVIAALGIASLVQNPVVLTAVDPRHAVSFFVEHGWHGFAVLGAVFLVVTGGEALYADMGHFGTRPIRIDWFAVVLPSLLLNYFGQGALVYENPDAAHNPFYLLAPAWAIYPMIVLALAAAVIASQAVISGAYSLTMQAVQLGFSPRLKIDHTSTHAYGQIYVGVVNWALMIGCVLIVLAFQTSSNLAAAYGVAVTSTMVITTLLLYVVARERWRWSRSFAGLLAAIFLVVDLAFFGANIIKVAQGGWLPIVLAGVVFAVMTTWKTGRRLLAERIQAKARPLDEFLRESLRQEVTRVPGTAIFMNGTASRTPPALRHNLRHNRVLHERVLFVTVKTLQVPYVSNDRRASVEEFGSGIYRVKLFYGFMEDPHIPRALEGLTVKGAPLADARTATYFLGRETIIASRRRRGMAAWRERLFALLSRNATTATAYFGIPAHRVVELGEQIEI
jgi:KUP system potassium uptake protein